MTIFPVSSHGPPFVRVCALISSYDTNHIVTRGPHMTSFYLCYLFKGPTSEYGHILRHWRLELQDINLGEVII